MIWHLGTRDVTAQPFCRACCSITCCQSFTTPNPSGQASAVTACMVLTQFATSCITTYCAVHVMQPTHDMMLCRCLLHVCSPAKHAELGCDDGAPVGMQASSTKADARQDRDGCSHDCQLVSRTSSAAGAPQGQPHSCNTRSSHISLQTHHQLTYSQLCAQSCNSSHVECKTFFACAQA